MVKAETISKASKDAGIKEAGEGPTSSMLPYYCSWYRSAFHLTSDRPAGTEKQVTKDLEQLLR